MPQLTVATTVTYGDTTPDGAVPCREPLAFSLTYTEASVKIVQIAASATDFEISLDTVGLPKFLLVKALDVDVSIKLSDGVTADPTPTSLAYASGWLMISNPNGQAIQSILVTTPSSPTSGARLKLLAFE